MFYNLKLNLKCLLVAKPSMLEVAFILFSRESFMCQSLCVTLKVRGCVRRQSPHWAPQLQEHLDADELRVSIDFILGGRDFMKGGR